MARATAITTRMAKRKLRRSIGLSASKLIKSRGRGENGVATKY
jgi:hypothetical protein